ncbi:MAG: ABC transporter substrate-binding protein [Polyangiales bacterium]
MTSRPFDDALVMRELSRRKLLIGGGAGLLAGAFALRQALRPRTQVPVQASGGSEPRRGGRLKVAFDGAAITTFNFDPHNSGFAPHNRVMRSLYDNLTYLRADQSVAPWLAESWEISPDRTEYTFKLRAGVKFHDGSPLDAEALKANFERVGGKGSVLYSRSCLGPFEGAEVVAPDRVRVKLAEPFTPLLRNLSMTKLSLVSPSAVAKHGKHYSINPVGTGPFKFVSMRQGSEIRLVRNADYAWAPENAAHAGPPLLDELTFLNVPEEGTRVAVLQSGQADTADIIPPQFIPSLRADPRFALLEQELLDTNYAISINVTRAPWDDEVMRLALRLSLDIDTIVRVIYQGNIRRAWSLLSPSMLGTGEAALANSWQPDPKRAAELLTSRGWIAKKSGGLRERDGKTLTLRLVDSQGNREKRLDVMHLARAQLAASGIGLVIDTQPAGMYADKLNKNDYDITASAGFHADPDILRQSYDPTARVALTGMRVDDPELTALVREAARTDGDDARAALYLKAQRHAIDKTYQIPIYVLRYNVASARHVHGVRLDAHGFPEFRDAWLDVARS